MILLALFVFYLYVIAILAGIFGVPTWAGVALGTLIWFTSWPRPKTRSEG